MESDVKEPTGVTRGQNVVHVMPVDWSAAESVLGALVDRIDPARSETQVLVITADAESATAAADHFVSITGDRSISVLPATGGPRAARLLRSTPAHIVTGAPSALVALLQASALKAEAVRTVVFAWLDPILETSDAAPLETLLGELPKEGARIILAGELTPAYEALIERYARRARRSVEAAGEDEATPLNAEYVTTSASTRSATLKRLLDGLDLPRAALYARAETVRADAGRVVKSLGYPAGALSVVSEDASGSSDPIILLELPATKAAMKALAGTTGRRIYAIVQPSQLKSLRQLLGGGTLAPITMIDAAERARGHDASMRASLREVLTSGDVRREILALEPLLGEFDGIEIAAAALRLLEQQRPERPAQATAPAVGPLQRLFVNLGEKDGVRAQELIKLIATEAGLPGSQVGKIEVRDTHSIVEVAAAAADLVVQKITGAAVRGRKVQARIDKPRDDRDRGPRPPRSRDDGPRGRDDGPPRGPRPPRSGPPRGGTRRFERDAAPARPVRPRPRRDDA